MTAFPAILAALVHPALFWGGAGAVAAPIIIHLLARRRFRTVRWAAMEFLFDAEQRNRRRVEMEDLILLLLRCLALVLLALLIARPFVRPTGVGALFGGATRVDRIFLLDDSFSMGHTSDGTTAFDRAKQGIANLVGRLQAHAPNDTVTILRTSQLAAPLVSAALLDDKQIEQILARLEGTAVSQQALSIDACLDGLRRVLDEDPGIVSAAIYVLSDFQRIDWVDRGGSTTATPLAAQLSAWARDERSVRLVLVDVGDDAAENLAITRLAPAQRQIVTGVDARLAIRIDNFATTPRSALELDITTPQGRQSARVDQLPAGRSTTTEISLVVQRAGDAIVQVALPPDDLPIDNQRSLAVQVSPAIRILLVNGEPSADGFLDEVRLLSTALRPDGDVASGNQVDVIDEATLEGTDFEPYHLVVLCNVYRVSELVADALHRFVFDGGGLAVFVGDQVSDPARYNTVLYRDGDGLLPAALSTVIAAAEPGVALAASDFQHPVVRIFSGSDNPFLRRIGFRKFFVTQPADAPDPADDAAPDGAAGGSAFRPSATVLARFDDNDGTPAMIERPYGRGRVLLFTSTCDLEWNDWAKDPSYVVTMLECAQHLARATGSGPVRRVGEPIILPIDPSRIEPTVTVRGPAYPQEPADEIAASPSDSGGLQVVWADTGRAGPYTFQLRRRDGATTSRTICVQLDELESDLAPATESELRTALAGVPVKYVAGVPAASDEDDEGRRELWRTVLLAALVVLMGEQYLAFRFGRR